MAYTEVVICWKDSRNINADMLIARLAEAGFEGFAEEENTVTAYILSELYSDALIENLDFYKFDKEHLSIEVKNLPDTNWNSVWESNFEPVYIGSCAVRAPFHPKPEGVLFDIVIEPKMSFGTGHHETTSLVVGMMLESEFENKTVLDMGCGTGVLAILAIMKGATHADAVDNDIWSYENTLENIERNNIKGIDTYHGSMHSVEGNTYDTVIANITRNILLEFIPGFSCMQEKGGSLFLSGFYEQDIQAVVQRAKEFGYVLKNSVLKNNWAAMELYKL